MTKCVASEFPALLQKYFCNHLIAQRDASPRTVASYRDTFRLLLSFAEEQLRKTPARMQMTDLDPSLVVDFLDHVESKRGNTARTRNLRLTAIRSFMRFASQREPATLSIAQRVLSIPPKRLDRVLVGFLSREEIEAILAAPDPTTWSGRRDRILFGTLYNTGARVSEIVGVRRGDLTLERSAFVRLHGKGRKERSVPLWPKTAANLREWLAPLPDRPDQSVFPNRSGNAMSRSGVAARLRLAVQASPSVGTRSISPHTVRHTTAMHLLQAGVDITVIALWLGHESPTTTHLYVEADLEMKERALAMVPSPDATTGRYKPTDQLLAFLEGL